MELMSTIDEASTHLETFISERDNLKVLEDCIHSLQQIRGSLELIQLHGACELAGEILLTATKIDPQNPHKLDQKLAALTKGFFVLSCYFEYTQQHEIGMPVLLIPYINDIRIANNEALMPESYFEPTVTSYRRPITSQTVDIPVDKSKAMLRRFRHMFQLGLLGLMKDQHTSQSIKLIHHATTKLYKLSKGYQSETLWWLAAHSLTAFVEAGLTPTITRKRLFAQLEKLLKHVEKNGLIGFDVTPPDDLLKELAFYIAISGAKNPIYSKIIQLFGLDNIGYTESILLQESVALTGPSANTVQSVADVLRVELNISKENIERVQTSDTDVEAEYEDTISRLQKVKDILNVVGLTSASGVLTEPLEHLQEAYNKQERMQEIENSSMVDAFLYVESVLNSLEKRNFSGDKLEELNKLTQNEMISNNHLQSAQLVVIEETELGLSEIKQALTGFADSNYDKAHLQDIATRLDEVRGGMIVLSQPRAAAIISGCSEFINQTLMATEEPAALEHMLETFADALICLEYYLDCMKIDKNISDNTLSIAEESLAALGYTI